MTLLIHYCSLRPIYCMADLEEPRGDQVADQDAAGDDEGVENGEWSVVVQMVLVVSDLPWKVAFVSNAASLISRCQ